MGQDTTKVIVVSSTGFQFLPKSVTLDDSDTEGLLCSCFENTCVFGVHHEFLNEDTHITTGKHAGVVTVGPMSFIRIFTRVASTLA